ncbi:MAG: alpha/beta hydrolase [Pseudopedobacter saltans]|uniref:Alpha/beta hydrolase n=1 Tax=Pseudopedobacter saltans TaxID=151895 RepID=A0A2W5EGG4_9SPHI|nr:MAG: alpha/beta hydrolase [Pseudopedobacter saltans]
MFFEYKGKNIYYKKIGSGNTTLVFIHGFPEDGSIFDKQTIFLSEKFQIIVPDLPGAGQSAYNDKLDSVEAFGQAIVSLLQYEKIEKPILLGHSMGGYITLAIEELYPNFSKAFGFINSTAFADTEEKKENRRKSIALMEKYGSAAFVKKAIPGNFSENFVKENSKLMEQLITIASSFPKEGLQRFYEIMIDRPDLTSILKQTHKPVLFFIGAEDQAAPLSDLLQQVKLPQTSHIHILPNVAHMSMLEAPESVNQWILDFVLEK